MNSKVLFTFHVILLYEVYLSYFYILHYLQNILSSSSHSLMVYLMFSLRIFGAIVSFLQHRLRSFYDGLNSSVVYRLPDQLVMVVFWLLVCLLCFSLMYSTIGSISRSLDSVLFLMYQGASVMILKTLFRIVSNL